LKRKEGVGAWGKVFSREYESKKQQKGRDYRTGSHQETYKA